MKTSAVIVAAGTGSRAGFGRNKLLETLADGERAIEKTVRAFTESGAADEIVLVVSPADEAEMRALFPAAVFARGGNTRSASVKSGLLAASGEIVLVHDGARPFVNAGLIRRCAESAEKYGSGVAAVPAAETLAAGEGGKLTRIYGKEGNYTVQTPQAFRRKDLLAAFEKETGDFPDESSLYLKVYGPPRIVESTPANRKLTFREDFGVCRAGNGYDTHAFTAGRPLVLCGVRIPYEKGLLGHSDADAPLHALADALLSAAGLRDIGYYFPDTDPRWEGADSANIVRAAVELARERGFAPVNASISVLAEKPKLSPYIAEMKTRVAKLLNVPPENVGIAATTTEKLGFIGREEGIAAYACVLLGRASGKNGG